MKKLRVAVAGLGNIGRKHLDAFRELSDRYDVTAACEPSAQNTARCAEERTLPPLLPDFNDVLTRNDVDVVDICTPHHLHYEQILQALAAGKHVICEKPVVGSLEECDAVIEAERSTGRRVMPIFQYRFGVGLQKLLHLIRQGIVGKHYLSTVETAWQRGAKYYGVAWRGQLATGMGGCLLTQALHAHDALTFALGRVRRVCALTATRVNPVEVEDCAAASLQFADGSLASLSVTLGSAEEISRMRLCFEHLTAQSSLDPYTMTSEPWSFFPRNDEAAARIDAALADFVPHPEGFVGQFLRFHEAMTERRELPVTLADARDSLELLTALYHSAADGVAVELPLTSDHPSYAGWHSVLTPTD